MLARVAWIGVFVIGCSPGQGPQKPNVSTQVNDDDPPVHWHPHPEIPPDELGDESDAGPIDAKSASCPPRDTPPAPAPKLRIASGPPVTNYIPPEVIMRPVRKRIACLRQCFESGLAREPSLRGRIVFQFVVEGDGWVRKVKVRESELGAPEVEECMRSELVGLAYEAPTGGGRITVVYPMVFESAR